MAAIGEKSWYTLKTLCNTNSICRVCRGAQILKNSENGKLNKESPQSWNTQKALYNPKSTHIQIFNHVTQPEEAVL